MDAHLFTHRAADGTELAGYRWDCTAEPSRIVVVIHGLAEHAGRYARFAQALNDAGAVVYSQDNRGHGRTAALNGIRGRFGPGGWRGLVSDIGALVVVAKSQHPGLPVAVVGHSLGSFALQNYLLDHSHDISAAALSGTTALDVLAQSVDPEAGADLSAFNAAFEPGRTGFEWLSRDEAEVDLYVADPDCGFEFEAGALPDVFANSTGTSDPAALGGIRPDLPIYVFSGSDDPLAAGGQLIDLVAQRYRDAGVTDVTEVVYPGARHEVLNETNRREVTVDFITWLDRVMPG